MYTNFGWPGLSNFEDLLLFGCFQKRPIFLLSHGCQKFNQLELIQKNIQVGVNFKYMYINFGGCGLSGFGDIDTSYK